MPLTATGKFGPEGLFKAASVNGVTVYVPLTSPSVTVPNGYTATISGGNFTITGPPAENVAVTIKDGTTTVATLSVTVEATVTELAADIDAAAAAAAAAQAAATAAATELGSNPSGDYATVADRLAAIAAGTGTSTALQDQINVLKDRVDAIVASGSATHSHDVDDVTGLAAIAKSGLYSDLTGSPAQLVKWYTCVNGVYQAWDSNAAVTIHVGNVNPGPGRPGSFWTPTADNFTKYAF